jgi:hypothetical protein
MLDEGDVQKAEAVAKQEKQPTRGWIEALIRDHRDRVALELKLARQVHELRLRLDQAFSHFGSVTKDVHALERLRKGYVYLMGLVIKVYATAVEGCPPWQRSPCPLCGTPSGMPSIGSDGAQAYHHADGTVCRVPVEKARHG